MECNKLQKRSQHKLVVFFRWGNEKKFPVKLQKIKENNSKHAVSGEHIQISRFGEKQCFKNTSEK